MMQLISVNMTKVGYEVIFRTPLGYAGSAPSRPNLNAIEPPSGIARARVIPDERQRRHRICVNACPIHQVRGRLNDVVVSGGAIDRQAKSPVRVTGS